MLSTFADEEFCANVDELRENYDTEDFIAHQFGILLPESVYPVDCDTRKLGFNALIGGLDLYKMRLPIGAVFHKWALRKEAETGEGYIVSVADCPTGEVHHAFTVIATTVERFRTYCGEYERSKAALSIEEGNSGYWFAEKCTAEGDNYQYDTFFPTAGLFELFDKKACTTP